MKYIPVSTKEKKQLDLLGFLEEMDNNHVFYINNSEVMIFYVEFKDGKKKFLLEYLDKKGNNVNIFFSSFSDLIKAIPAI